MATGFYRAPVSGGTSQLIFAFKDPVNLRCTGAAGNFCAYDSKAEHELVITAFDPLSGKQRELLRIPFSDETGSPAWAPSPDGSLMAILTRRGNASEIRFLPFGSGSPRVFAINGYSNVWTLDWAKDSESVFTEASWAEVTESSWASILETLLNIDLKGHVQAIRWPEGYPRGSFVYSIPSPDGRHIAMDAVITNATVWMIDDF